GLPIVTDPTHYSHIQESYYGGHVANQRTEKTYEGERAAQSKTCQQTSKTIILWGSHRLSMTQENVRRGKSCATKNLLADLKDDHTMGITLLADDLRKRTKRNELRNQKLASRPKKLSYRGDHVACRRPKKMYEEERAVQPKTC
ncbi:hypothetical protein PanWU01x14_119940, partial [Parasponia andersonii]